MTPETKSTIKWKTILGLVLLFVAMAMNWNWIFGFLFMLWAFNDARSAETHFVESIRRNRNPILFWIIIGVWILLSSYYFVEPWLRS